MRALLEEDDVISYVAEVGVGGRSLAQEVEAQQVPWQLVRRLERHHLQSGRRGYQEWVQAPLKQGAGALHKLTNTWGQPHAGAGRGALESGAALDRAPG